MTEFALRVNNNTYTVDIEDNKPLLWILRDDLELTGTKYSCGEGLCGSCTVLINGEARRSCVTLANQVTGAEITTIEGLSPDGKHPVQVAWLEEKVSQCGYCQAGQILNAVSLLEQSPNPSDEEINSIMSNVLCRCGTYQRIRAAIHRAAEGS